MLIAYQLTLLAFSLTPLTLVNAGYFFEEITQGGGANISPP